MKKRKKQALALADPGDATAFLLVGGILVVTVAGWWAIMRGSK